MTYKYSLFKRYPFEIRKVFTNTKRLLPNTKSMLFSNKKEMLFFKYGKFVFPNSKNVLFLNKNKMFSI